MLRTIHWQKSVCTHPHTRLCVAFNIFLFLLTIFHLSFCVLKTHFFCVLKIQFLCRFQIQFFCVLKIQFLRTKSDCLLLRLLAVGLGNIICPHEGASFCYRVFFWVQLSSCLPLSVDLGPFICIVWIPSTRVCLCGQSMLITLLCSLSTARVVFGRLYSALTAERCRSLISRAWMRLLLMSSLLDSCCFPCFCCCFDRLRPLGLGHIDLLCIARFSSFFVF